MKKILIPIAAMALAAASAFAQPVTRQLAITERDESIEVTLDGCCDIIQSYWGGQMAGPSN